MLTDSITTGKREEDIERPASSNFQQGRKRVVIVGSGAAGLSAAWLLRKNHNVTVIDSSSWSGGHAHTAWVEEEKQTLIESPCANQISSGAESSLAVDTGFIVYNEVTYPNFTAWMKLLGVSTQATDMSFAVSRNEGDFEYAGGTFTGLFAQPSKS